MSVRFQQYARGLRTHGYTPMSLAERTAALLRTPSDWPVTRQSLILAMARSEGLASGELKRLSPHWYNIGRYEQECAAWEATQTPMDVEPVIVEPRDSLREREPPRDLLEVMCEMVEKIAKLGSKEVPW